MYLAGIFLLWNFREPFVIHAWHTAPGVVIGTEVIQLGSGPTGDSGACLGIKYRYTVNGQAYVGWRFSPLGMCPSASPENVALLPPGRPLTISYDARDPTFAVLNPAFEWRAVAIWLAIVGGIALCHWSLVRDANVKADPEFNES